MTKVAVAFPKPAPVLTNTLESDLQFDDWVLEGPIIDEKLMSNTEKPNPLKIMDVPPEEGMS